MIKRSTLGGNFIFMYICIPAKFSKASIAKINTRENKFSRKLVHAKISTFKVAPKIPFYRIFKNAIFLMKPLQSLQRFHRHVTSETHELIMVMNSYDIKLLIYH